MGLQSKFLTILEKIIPEANFVKSDEKTKLPVDGEKPEDEEEIDIDAPESEEEVSGGEDKEGDNEETAVEPQPPLNTFTDREKDLLNIALQIYRSNPDNPLEYKNEFSKMYKDGNYEELLGRFIAIVDELI